MTLYRALADASRRINAALGGDPSMTLSARAAAEAAGGSAAWALFAGAVDSVFLVIWFEREHCWQSWLWHDFRVRILALARGPAHQRQDKLTRTSAPPPIFYRTHVIPGQTRGGCHESTAF